MQVRAFDWNFYLSIKCLSSLGFTPENYDFYKVGGIQILIQYYWTSSKIDAHLHRGFDCNLFLIDHIIFTSNFMNCLLWIYNHKLIQKDKFHVYFDAKSVKLFVQIIIGCINTDISELVNMQSHQNLRWYKCRKCYNAMCYL